MKADVIVIGAGLVGAAIAYGLASRGIRVLVLDGNDRDYRASNANGALVWLQSKGMGLPGYQQFSRTSVDLWPDFSAEINEATGFDLQNEHNGGLAFCLSETEFEQRRALLTRWHDQLGGSKVKPDWEMVGRNALAKLLPNVELGPEVVGASYGHRDGQCNSLRLLSALHAGIMRKGGQLRGGAIVSSIQKTGSQDFTVDLGDERISAARIVIAAGLGSKALAAQVGLDLAIRPQRGQMLVTERLEQFLPLPLHGISQTKQGTVLIGATKEEVGFDASTTSKAVADLSNMAVRSLPGLRGAKLVRQWAGLRIMTPDSCPIYQESETHPGAFVAVCHSGVTLAAAHAGVLADAIAAGRLTPFFDVFHQRRFDVPKAA
ncbi:FAD-dependent oxidoreductase [Sphingomonas oligophenolica]|uniref:FAD-dependent oxidoreductase n=1 Tax=Sphingomonas oligophenolica TaxID=301154 RepID=A0ABU9YAC5_9SPHN